MPDAKQAAIAQCLGTIRSADGAWAWGSEDGLIPWEDVQGHMIAVLWSTASAARAESWDEQAGDESEIFMTLAEIWARYDRWYEAGVEEIGLEPTNGRILLTCSLDEFRQVVTTGSMRRNFLP